MKKFVSAVLIAWLLPAYAEPQAQVQANSERVYVAFRLGGRAPVIAAIRAAAGTIHYEFDALGAIAATLPSAAVAALRNNPNVAYVEADPVRQPFAQTVPYGIDKVQARDIWDADRDGVVDEGAPTGSSRIVCIIDSGFLIGHADLASTSVTGTNNSGTGNWFEDTCGHGTHVAGTVVAGHNELGVVGVTPGTAQIHVVKVFDGPSCGWAYSSTLVHAANTCANAGANIISMSLGGGSPSTTESNAFANLYNNGILNVAAAGNGGNTQTSYPAGYASVISVAAVDQNNQVASFSQRNSDVELAAPGVGVLSTVLGGYQAWSGTSMATPHVSGVAALVWSANTGWSNVQIRDALQRTALDLGAAGRDTTYGYGLVKAKSALDYLKGSGGTTNTPPTASFTYSCSGLTCAFTSTSSDSDGSIVAHAWNFGDGSSSTAQNPSKTYAGGGTYSVSLTVTDDDVASSGAAQSVTVTGATVLSLSVQAYKVRGLKQAGLTWSGASGTSVDVFRNNVRIVTTANNGAYTDAINSRGGGSYTYRICNAGTTTCSNSVTVTF